MLTAALLLGGVAQAALTWDPAGPVPPTTGMSAVAVDPADPSVVWVASNASVWVSDDSGDSFNLVLQLSRAAAVTRAGADGGEVEVDTDPEEPVDGEELFDGSTSDEETENEDAFNGTPDVGFDGAVDGAVGVADVPASDARVAFGVTRLRVVGEYVFVCTGRGLYSVARTARRVGTAREWRLKRRIAVNDVVADAGGRLLVATIGGLWSIGQDGVGRPTGEMGVASVTALARVGTRVVAGGSDGIYMQSSFGLQRLGIAAARERVTDIVAVNERQFLLGLNDGVALVSAPQGQVPSVEQRWAVPGVQRVALGRDGDIWAVGSTGAWQFVPGEGWRRRSDGLLDRRLFAVASARTGNAWLWVVGRGGASRLIPEAVGVWSRRARQQVQRAIAGFPTAEETLEAALEARPVTPEDADDMQLASHLRALAPYRVRMEWRQYRERDEGRLLIPDPITGISRRFLDSVEITDARNEFRVYALWDLAPLLDVFGESFTTTQIHSARNRAVRAAERIYETVTPLYQDWRKRRIRLLSEEVPSARNLARDMLTVQRIEADLHVYTGGAFPISDIGGPATPAQRKH